MQLISDEDPATPAIPPESAGACVLEQALAVARPGMMRVLRFFRVPLEDANDLIQEVLVQFLRKQDEVKEPEHWLVGATRKECLMYWRRRRTRVYVALETVLDDLAQDAPQERVAVLTDLNRAVKTLRPRCRSLLRLRYALGFSTLETAAELGYTLASFDNVARRCLATLSQRLLVRTLAIRSRRSS